MESMRLVLICATVVVLALAEEVEDKYTTKFDHINVEDIMRSERLVNNYVKCALDKGKCAPEGKEFKKRITDALETMCRRCSAKQIEHFDKWFHFLYYKRRADYDNIANKYDPTGVYRKRYEQKYLRPENVAFPKAA